jgi:hypothetical protein
LWSNSQKTPSPSSSTDSPRPPVPAPSPSSQDLHAGSSWLQSPRVRSTGWRPLQVNNDICGRPAEEGSLQEARAGLRDRVLPQELHHREGRHRSPSRAEGDRGYPEREEKLHSFRVPPNSQPGSRSSEGGDLPGRLHHPQHVSRKDLPLLRVLIPNPVRSSRPMRRLWTEASSPTVRLTWPVTPRITCSTFSKSSKSTLTTTSKSTVPRVHEYRYCKTLPASSSSRSGPNAPNAPPPCSSSEALQTDAPMWPGG